MTRPRPLLFCDLDGVLVDIIDEVLDAVWHEFHVVITPEQVTQYDVTPIVQEATNAPDAAVAQWSNRIFKSPVLYSEANPYWEVHQDLLRYGPGNIIFVTARPATVMGVTVQWLQAHGFARSVLRRASTHEKGQSARDYLGPAGPAAIAIEDSPIAAASYHDKGFQHYLVARPWNNRVVAVERSPLPAVVMAPMDWQFIAEDLRRHCLAAASTRSIPSPPPQSG
jgi:uncharacterized HAD superfamily protein